MRHRRRHAVVLLGVTVLLAGIPATAHAGVGNGNGDERDNDESGGHNDGILSAETSTEIVISGDTDGDGGSLEPVDTDWTPPKCWYEPFATAEQFRDQVEALDGNAYRALNIWSPKVAFTDIYRDNQNGDEWSGNLGSRYAGRTYENYNLDRADEGLWWRGVINPNREDEFIHGQDCIEPIFWQDNGETPPFEESLTDEMLAEYAYDEIKIPDTEIEINPDDEQLLGVPMWIWLDAQEFRPRTVRAELPLAGLWAETTAEPVSLQIDPGTEDAEVYPADGECEIDDDGRIGQPYERGRADEDPPCGVKYLRATHNVDSFELTASLTWEVHWTGSQSPGEHPLPSGTFETTHEIVVEEQQTIIVP